MFDFLIQNKNPLTRKRKHDIWETIAAEQVRHRYLSQFFLGLQHYTLILYDLSVDNIVLTLYTD